MGPDVKTTRTEYNQGKANRKPTLSEAYYNVGDGKMAKLSGTIPKGDGNNVLPGDVFYRVRDEDLLTEQTLPYKKKGTGTGTGASSIGQDFALRVFGPVGAKKFTANIYYFNVEKGFPEDYIFPWGAKLTDLLPDGKGTEEPEKGRGDWNWYQAFEPVDGVKSSDVDIPF